MKGDFDAEALFGNVPDIDSVAAEVAADQEKRNQNGGQLTADFQPFISFMSVKKPTEVVRFLNNKPVLAYIHKVHDGAANPPYRNALCTRQDCDICNAGQEPDWQAVWLLLHRNHSYKNKQNKQISQPQIKVLMKGKNFAGPWQDREKQLANYQKSFTSQDMEMKQYGSGFSTTYTFNEIPGSEPLNLPATLPRFYPESAGKSVAEDREAMISALSSQEGVVKIIQRFLMNLSSQQDRARMIAVIQAGGGEEQGPGFAGG